MKKFSRILTSVLITIVLVSSLLAGCTAQQPAPAPVAGTNAVKKPTIAVIAQALNSEFWYGFAQGAKDKGQEMGAEVTVNGPMSETMVTEQIAMIEAAISKHVDGIVVAANQPGSIKSTFELAKKAGIPIVEVDVESNWEGRVAYVGAGNYEGGQKAAEWFLANVPENSEVAIIRGALGDPTHDLRANGLIDTLQKSGKLKMVTVQPANSERGLAVGVMENILTANPNVKAVFCTNDEMAMGALKAVQGIKKEVKIIGFDGNMDVLESIKSGDLAGTCTNFGYDEAALSVQVIKNFIDGKKPTTDRVLLQPVIVDKSNVDKYIVYSQSIVDKVKAAQKK